mmetsp:Transcript_9535/g.14089  ORF Transcript_9535/g.14089 Transcript_9535/m.14089 type:complete len:201 (-) Transcript_9535:29-631(-)
MVNIQEPSTPSIQDIIEPLTPPSQSSNSFSHLESSFLSPKALALSQRLSSSRKHRQDAFDLFDPEKSIEVERQLQDLNTRRRQALQRHGSPLFPKSNGSFSAESLLASYLPMNTNNTFFSIGLYCATKHWSLFGFSILVLILRRRLLAPSWFRKTLGILSWICISLKLIPWFVILSYVGYSAYHLFRAFSSANASSRRSL